MKHFEIKANDGTLVSFDFPNTVSEISDEYLKNITDAITVADNYSLIALCYSEKLSTLILTARIAKKNASVKVTPVFVKAGNTDNEFIKAAKMKQRVVSNSSQIALGTHVSAPYHKLTLNYFAEAVTNAANGAALYEEELNNQDQRDCVFIEFKLVPNADIIGLLDVDVPNVEKNYVQVTRG